MMEANKEEAERCIKRAEMFILDGKKDKAEKHLLKAERLFPTQKAKGRPRLLNFVILHACSALLEQRVLGSLVNIICTKWCTYGRTY